MDEGMIVWLLVLGMLTSEPTAKMGRSKRTEEGSYLWWRAEQMLNLRPQMANVLLSKSHTFEAVSS
jgi:hypothetical protein